jgi:hypothetical protein
MPSPARLRLGLSAVLLVLPATLSADSLCTLCFTTYRVPGGADSGGAGLYRFAGCPCCKPEDCKTAAKRAKGLVDRYKTLREEYERFSKEIADLRAGGQAIPASKIAEQARLNFALGQLEMQYSILNADCPKEVPGENIWDGLYEGPVANSPVNAKDDGGRGCRSAAEAAASYNRLAEGEQTQFEVINGFLNTAADGFAPPPTGYNGERARATRGYRALAGAYRKEAEIVKGTPGKADPKVDLTRAIVLKFPEIKVEKGGEEYLRNAGIAVRARLEGNTYILAYLQAREMYRQSMAAKNKAVAMMHARSAVEFAWQAQGYATWAADYQHKADVVYQKRLDASLATADKKGLTLAKLLEQFQAEVKKSGVPAHLADALTSAGATAEEQAAVKERLLALTPAAVEAVLKDQRERIKRGAEALDALVIETQLMDSRHWYHTMTKK